jgi:peptidoglycan/xylan/chitin deacetylase (PgdA/CDA1 family)
MKIRGSLRLKRTLNQLNLRGIILMYHRVAEVNCDPWQLSVTPSHFDEQMGVLKKYGRPVQMQEMGEKLRRFSLGKKEIVVSFDDAYSDNFHNAKPILERHGIPAIFFVITSAIGSFEEFWWDELERIALSVKTLPETFELAILGKKYSWRITSEGQHKKMGYIPSASGDSTELTQIQFYNILWEILSRSSYEEKREVLKQIARWTGQSLTPRQDYLPMTSGMLLSLARSPLFKIGAHTVSHPLLSRLSLEEQEEEIIRSKLDLEKIINKKIGSFSYPHGDYSEETVKLVERSKFKNACTIVQSPVTRNMNRYLLPRFAVLNWNGEQFEQNLTEWLT